MAAAAAAILVLCDSTASSTDVITGALEIIRMTGRAERLILRITPWDRAADGIAVTGRASGIPCVIARVITSRIMAEDIRRPGIRRVTDVALDGRVDMPNRLEGRAASGTVTVIASAHGARIVEPAATDEGRGGMTIMAIQASRDMGIMHASRLLP